MEEKFVNLAVGYDSEKEPISALKVISVKESKAKDIIAKAKAHEMLLAGVVEQKEQEQKDLNDKRKQKIDMHSYLITYLVFNDLVEKGAYETTQEFEKMFVDYLNGGSFNRTIAPKGFLKILERVL